MSTVCLPRIVPAIRWFCRRDMPVVLGIERACFPDPWLESDFTSFLRDRNSIALVAEWEAECVVGYLCYELCNEHLWLTNMAVHPAFQRRGIGTAMIDKLKGKLNPWRRKALELAVIETNLDAQLFFRSQGLRWVSTDRGHFENQPDVDAYVMQYRVQEAR